MPLCTLSDAQLCIAALCIHGPSILRCLCVSRDVTIPESDKIMHIFVESSDVLTLDQPHELLTQRFGVFDAECRGAGVYQQRCGAVVEQ